MGELVGTGLIEMSDGVWHLSVYWSSYLTSQINYFYLLLIIIDLLFWASLTLLRLLDISYPPSPCRPGYLMVTGEGRGDC
ncbi:hypothetical protein FKM82_010434 [Ascaphus truei]